ncbi:MAG TPA: hypothetical protein VGT08_05195 [Terracidiphilus sp.]|nr:hypothetical protein [Terracidiphilus sp.]
MGLVVMFAGLALEGPRVTNAQKLEAPIRVEDDRPVTLRFYGATTADLFTRELVMRGYYQHASLVAECLMHLVEKNQGGFYAFPRYFKGSAPGTGTEFDGAAAIVIAMEALWERLPAGRSSSLGRSQRCLVREWTSIRLSKRPLRRGVSGVTQERRCSPSS